MKATIAIDESGNIVGMLIRQPALRPEGSRTPHVELVAARGRTIHEIEIPQDLQSEEGVRALPRTHRLIVQGTVLRLVPL